MAGHRISVALLGHPDPDIASQLIWTNALADQEAGFNVIVLADDGPLARVVAERRPHAIFTFGDLARFPQLHRAPLEVRRRWLHFEQAPSGAELAERALELFVDSCLPDPHDDIPLVSVLTLASQCGEGIRRPLASLLGQTYPNWEWVVYDHSPAEHSETWRQLCWYAAHDARLVPVRGDGTDQRRGEARRRLAALARGSILMELDDADEFTDHHVADVIEGFSRFPSAGFAYSDVSELFPDGRAAGSPPGWGFGDGSYRTERYRDHDYTVTNLPPINAKTVRHLLGLPRRARAWRRTVYEQIGGYASNAHLAEDFDLLVRTFLATDLLYIRRFGYIHHLPAEQTTLLGPDQAEIMRLVHLFAAHHEPAIQRRLAQLGAPDFLRTPNGLDWSRPTPSATANVNLTMT